MTTTDTTIKVPVYTYAERAKNPRRWRLVASFGSAAEAFAAGPWKLGRPSTRDLYHESRRLLAALQEAQDVQTARD